MMKQFYPMMRAVLAVSLWIVATETQAQSPAWQSLTAGMVATGSSATVRTTATDAQGNVFIAGHFYGSVALGGTMLVSAGNSDGFVAKWSPMTGDFVWAQRLGGATDDGVSALAVSGNTVYAAGRFSSTADFGAGSLQALGTPGTLDSFVTQLTDTGTSASFGWAQRLGGADADEARALAVRGSIVYVAGFFTGPTASFGSIILTNGSPALDDIYVAKLTDTGASAAVSWALGAGGMGDDRAVALAVRGSSVYVAGQFGSSGLSNIPSRFGAASLTAEINGDAFVARLTDAGASGAFDWAVAAGSTDVDLIIGLAVNGSNVYAVGSFGGSTLALGSLRLASNGYIDGFVAKLTDAGSGGAFIWARPLGGPADDQALAVAVRGPSIYVTGAFGGLPTSFGTTTLLSNGLNDVYVAKLTDAGPSATFDWAQGAGGPRYDYGAGVALSGNRVVAVGVAQSGARFGTFITPVPATGQVPYVATLLDPTLTAATAALRLESIGLYPNPAHGTVTIHLPGTGPTTLTLLDALGRTLRTQPAPGNAPAELDLTGLAPGLYAVRVAAGGSTATRRLVVE